MKLPQHANELETNAEVKSQDFSIGDASKIIGILRNYMYQHKVRTLVQEYMSNARDAMREAGTSKRIVVTVPNSLNPVFKVRDFGPGITPHRMSNVFLKYGASTKEGSNKQTGGFGVGAKSAWAYTDSFTVVSITGGMKRTYVAHTGVNNQGRCDEISCVATDEPNGVEIQVAVKNGDLGQFRDAVFRASYFWKDEEFPEFKGVVSHEVPQRKLGSLRLGDLEMVKDLPYYMGLDTNHYKDYCSLVIDGIPYKMDKAFIGGIPELKELLSHINSNVLIHVGNGVMDIPASRESVTTIDENKAVLAKLAPKLLKELVKYVKNEFAKAKSYSEWIIKFKELSKSLEVEEYSNRGDYDIVNGGITSKKFKDFELYEVGPNHGRRSKGGFKREEVGFIQLDNLAHIFFVDNHDEFLVTQNRRVKEYLEKTGQRKVILLMAKEQSEMVPEIGPAPKDAKPLFVSKVLTTFAESEKSVQQIILDLGGKALSTLPYTPIVREAKEKRVKEHQEFTIHRYRGYGRKCPVTRTLSSVESDGDKYLYVEYKDYNKHLGEFRELKDFVESLGYYLCALTPKSIKTVAGSKNFKSYSAWLASYVPDASIVASVCSKNADNKKEMQILSHATDKIMDPVLVEMLTVYKDILKSNPMDVPKKVLSLISKQVDSFEKCDNDLTKLISKNYPLLRDVNGNNAGTANEAVFYINAKV